MCCIGCMAEYKSIKNACVKTQVFFWLKSVEKDDILVMEEKEKIV